MSENSQNFKDLSIEEMEAIVANKRIKEEKKREKARAEYESNRDKLVESVVNAALKFEEELKAFKSSCGTAMQEQAQKLAEYGGIRSNSKGGFTITHSNNNLRITRRRDTEPKWDERSAKAEELIKDFLTDTIKKRDLKLYEILMGFLERNQHGALEYSRVMDLLKHQDKFSDARWVEGLKLIKESFSNVLRGFGFEFKVKDTEGDKWRTINLTFASA